jgi:hypothetical protein
MPPAPVVDDFDMSEQVRWAVPHGKLGHGFGHLAKAEPKANSSRALSA